MSETYACLSIRQPWANLIVFGIKNIENRNWYCAFKGPLLIHAGKTWSKDEENNFNSLMNLAREMRDQRRIHALESSRVMLGGLVGVCQMIGCVQANRWFDEGGTEFDGKNNWFVGPYGYFLEDARQFKTMIPYKGQQGLFRVPKSILQVYQEIIS